MARKGKKKVKYYAVPLEAMQELWKLGRKVKKSKKIYSRKRLDRDVD